MDFFYQISCCPKGEYSWRPAWKGVVTADDKKSAKKKINELFDEDFKEKISRKMPEPEFRLFITDMDDHWRDHWLGERTCEVCSVVYVIIHAEQAGQNPTRICCSQACAAARRKQYTPEHLQEGYLNPKATIYKITNKSTEQSYIGKTTQPFTLRWWQHFSHPSDTKFHKAIRESSVTEWVFEIVEVLSDQPTNALISKREQFWINHFNTIQMGYNSVPSVKEIT